MKFAPPGEPENWRRPARGFLFLVGVGGRIQGEHCGEGVQSRSQKTRRLGDRGLESRTIRTLQV